MDMVFASVVRNEELLKVQSDIVANMYSYALTCSTQGTSPIGLPKIKTLDDVYKYGVFCQAKVKEDKTNPFSPVTCFL